jgi:peptidoglycan-N-acetylglucosamine deacetylase
LRALVVSAAAAAPFVAAGLWWWSSPLAAIAVLALSHALVLYPTLRPNVQWLGPVITRFDTKEQELWLTIDDGPTRDTPQILDLLDRHEVKATFFVKGRLAEIHDDFVKSMVARGHSVANHSYSHPSATFWCLLPGRLKAEVDECEAVLSKTTQTRQRWFRAPVGMKNPAVHPILKRRGLKLIGWSARAFDATMSDVEGVLARLLPSVEPGAIIVLHQGRAWSVRVIEKVIVELKNRGYTFVIPDDGRLQTNR